MSSVQESSDRRTNALAALALALGVILIVALGLMLPGAGIALALALAYTVYRDDRRLRRRLIVLGLAVTAISIALTVLAYVGDAEIEPSVPLVVRPD